MKNTIIVSLEKRMNTALDLLREEFSTLRTGRTSTSLLEHLQVMVYGQLMPLNQVATLSVPEPRLIVVQPWDKSNLKVIEKAVQEADLGLNPISDGALIRVPLPELTEERRKELVKVVHKYAEQSRVAIRNVRRDGMDQLKKSEKNREISQDERRQQEKIIQTLTDGRIEEINQMTAHKEDDILQV